MRALLFGTMDNLSSILIPSSNHCANAKPDSEAYICIAFANYLRERSLRDNMFPFIWFHVCNEFSGARKPFFGMQQSWMGKVPGVADFCLISKEKSLFIEFKVKGGKQTNNQKVFAAWCQSLNIEYNICYSANEAILLVEGINLQKKI